MSKDDNEFYVNSTDERLNYSTKDDKRFNDKSFKEILLDIVAFFNINVVLFALGFAFSAVIYGNIDIWSGLLMCFMASLLGSLIVYMYNKWK